MPRKKLLVDVAALIFAANLSLPINKQIGRDTSVSIFLFLLLFIKIIATMKQRHSSD